MARGPWLSGARGTTASKRSTGGAGLMADRFCWWRLVMPQMGGPALAQRLLALRPDLKVIYVSGYEDDALGDRQCSSGRGVHPEAVSARHPRSQVREILDASVV